MSSNKIFRLPPLPRFRIKHPTKEVAHPCTGVLSSVLGCWASKGHGVQGCEALETALRTCMDTMKKQTPKKSTINFHMARLYPLLAPKHKPRR